jgi:CHASE2 domain-containing sensor protein
MAMSTLDFNNGSALLVNKRVIYIAVIVLCVVLLVGFSLFFLGTTHRPSFGLVVGVAIVSATYTVASFSSLMANTFEPYLAAKALIFSFFLYAVAFYLMTPQNSAEFLTLSGGLFLLYTLFLHFSISKNGRLGAS